MTLASLSPQAALPSPANAVWQLGPVPVRAYALCIVLGIVVACAVTELRLRRRGAAPWAVLDIAVWAVPFGIVGARIYHVITSPGSYFGEGGEPLRALYIWEGGLGIWGAVAGGAVGAWLAARQLGLPLTMVADALAPGMPLAQAVGRIGNWFNNELFGGQTTLPWGLEIHRMDQANPGKALLDDSGNPVLEPGLFHPTFLYEALWNVGVAGLVLFLDRRLKLGRGRAFALYVMGYTVGRFWIEMMRTDEATEILGARLNVWTAVLVFLGALVYFVRVRGPQEFLVPVGGAPAPLAAGDTAASDVSQVDVSREPAAVGAPIAYQVVTEEQFRRFQETGEVPPAEDPSAPARAERADADADAAYDDDSGEGDDDGRDGNDDGRDGDGDGREGGELAEGGVRAGKPTAAGTPAETRDGEPADAGAAPGTADRDR
ncbi:prolipoprotein diacylglyceryl transferase [Micromonospora sp. WMMD1102]|uniref:prolipoprotein diacylglyceryl transferase n=1 Tax=Micromonospora sp. WMMD1102 TaxID=3016105 RepID=UPI00241579FB|nr:prolipoprotein diacylglyceryl transferase [Micromonospora sp. WMMD1102]MDG4788702.1 prolipoprotein diacylglyceryl transferase [Micromonospora sp. WMMD1102]